MAPMFLKKYMIKHDHIATVFICAMVSLLFACTEDPPGQPFNSTDNKNRSIRVTVHHVFDSILYTDSLVPYAEVKIYSDYDQFITDGPANAIRYSDSSGVALFEYRDEDYYWIKCYHPAHGFVTDSVSTPPYTVSFVEMFYYF